MLGNTDLYVTLFYWGQFAFIGSFMLMHFLLGRKRGLQRTVWFFVCNILMYAGLVIAMGNIHLAQFINQEQLGQIVTSINNPDVTKYYNYLVDAEAVPFALAVIDLVIKIVIFILFNMFLGKLFQFIIFLIPGMFHKNMTKKFKKRKFLGGMVGLVRGAALGVFLLIPSLVLLNTFVEDGIESEDPQIAEFAVLLTEMNEKSLIHSFNEVKIGDEGAANSLFDYMFVSKVNEEEKFVWRDELGWIAEGARSALPEIQKLMNNEPIDNFTLEDLNRYQGLFTMFAESQFLDSMLKPGIKVGLTIMSDSSENPIMTDEELEALFEKIDSTDVVLSKDLKDIFTAAQKLFAIRDLKGWNEVFSDPVKVLAMDEEQQALFKDSLLIFANLDILKFGDLALEVALLTDEAKELITLDMSDEEKIAFLTNAKEKIQAFNGEFVTKALTQTANFLDQVLFKFPGVDLDNDGVTDVTLSDFISNLSDLTYILNEDENYHLWFKDTLQSLASIEIIDVFMEEVTTLGLSMFKSGLEGWSDEEFNKLQAIINEKFNDTDDLKRELKWIAEVYFEISKLGIQNSISESLDITILDSILTTSEGRTQFTNTINKLLEGELISELTSKMSSVLISKFLTEPLDLVEPITNAANLSTFSFSNEIKQVVSIISGLYEEGLVLADVLNEESDMFTSLLPIIINFVQDDENKDKVLDSEILYSFISYNLLKLDLFTLPTVSIEASGLYEGWVKKLEISTVLTILGDFSVIMEDQGISFADLLSGESENLLSSLMSVIKTYAAVDENRETLLSSNILYSTISTELLKVDAIEIPQEAIVSDVNSPYYEWIENAELDKLLQAIIALDIELPEEGASLDLSSVTGQKLRDVIGIGSKIITRNITTQLVAADIFKLPEDAFVNTEKKDLKQAELVALADLLVTLDIGLDILSEGSGGSSLLDSILVSNLTSITFENSLIIRAFITFGISTGLGELHQLALDPTYPDLLNNDEITALFAILDSLDKDGDMSVQGLMTSLDPETLSINQIKNTIQAGDSIIIRNLLSSNLLAVEMISDLTLKDDAYHQVNGVYHKDLISYTEMINLIDSLAHIASSDDALIMELVEALDINAMKLSQITNLVGENSIIINALVSDNIIKLNVIDMHPQALDSDNQIINTHLVKMLSAFEAGLGADTTIGNLSTIADTLSIQNLRSFVTADSIIVKYFMTNTIIESIGEAYDREAARDTQDALLLSNDEFNKIFNGLGSLDTEEDESTPIKALVDNLLNLTLDKVIGVVDTGSHILRARISHEITNSLTKQKVYPLVYDANNDINQTDLSKLFEALSELGGDTELSNLGTMLTDGLSIQSIQDMRAVNSLIFEGLISTIIGDAMTTKIDIREDAYVNYDDAVIGFEGFKQLSSTEITNLINSFGILAGSPDDSLLSIVDNVQISSITPLKLTEIANEESIIFVRLITDLLTDATISAPTTAYQNPVDKLDFTFTEIANLGLALHAFGLTTLDVNSLEPNSASLTVIANVASKDSKIVNRMISEALVSADLDNVESNIGMELTDIQTEEIVNLINGFIKLGITSIETVQNVSFGEIYTRIQALEETEFKTLIGYEVPYDPNTEDLGMTLYKDFLINKLDGVIPSLEQPGQFISVKNRQELLDLVIRP